MSSKALIAMSGGVDSSVAAWLTQQAGFSCVGATMRLLDGSADDISDAKAVADRLGMPFHVLDLREEFRRDVMADFVRCYESGLTPNPCIVCNKKLKFGHLLDAAMAMDCRQVVTGHYARICKEDGRYLLKKAADPGKDQSYFLYSLTQHQLSHTRFPLGVAAVSGVRVTLPMIVKLFIPSQFLSFKLSVTSGMQCHTSAAASPPLW